MTTKAKNIKDMDAAVFALRINNMNNLTEAKKESVASLHVYISKGNSKTNELVPSVSLVPVRCCPNCKCCSRKCYDVRNDCVYATVQNTRAINTAIWECDPDRYFKEISKACKGHMFFRWHIGGDIVNEEYLMGMVRVANENKHCKFLAFTKNFEVVNTYMDKAGSLPENMHIIFSDWVGQDTPNPHDFPTSNPVFADGSTTAKYGAFYCTGNCSECAVGATGCWGLKKGEQVAFLAH